MSNFLRKNTFYNKIDEIKRNHQNAELKMIVDNYKIFFTMSNIKNRTPKKQNNIMLKMKKMSLKKIILWQGILMVFKVGCIRPCERKGKIQCFFHFHRVKMRSHYHTIFRIFKNTTMLLPYLFKKSSKIDYAIFNHAKLYFLNILRFSFTWGVPCSIGNKTFFILKCSILLLCFQVVNLIICVVMFHYQ